MTLDTARIAEGALVIAVVRIAWLALLLWGAA
jgi:hypothetical protein